jgi:hypothetical protein
MVLKIKQGEPRQDKRTLTSITTKVKRLRVRGSRVEAVRAIGYGATVWNPRGTRAEQNQTHY